MPNMPNDTKLEWIPVSYDPAGKPKLYAEPLTVADLCGPDGRWTVLRAPNDPQTAGQLRGVVFPTAQTGYVWGMDGLLMKTDNGGRTWTFLRHDLPTIYPLLSFPTPTIGYVGVRRVALRDSEGRCVPLEASWTLGSPQTLIRSGDGGQTWDLLTPLVDAPLPRYNRAFLPYSASYNVTDVAARPRYEPADEAQESLQEFLGILGYVAQIQFPRADVGYALMLLNRLPGSTTRVLLCTDNGGYTWRIMLAPEQLAPADNYPWPMVFPQPDTGYILLRDKFLYTENGGITWEDRPSPSRISVRQIVFPTTTTGYLLGIETASERGKGHRILQRTQDGGHNWQMLEIADVREPLACASQRIILAGGTAGAILRSTDGGQTWHQVPTGTPHTLLALACPDEETCYGVASDATIVKSGDSGQTWQVLTTGVQSLYQMLEAHG